jgi:hypothetical protein
MTITEDRVMPGLPHETPDPDRRFTVRSEEAA